MLWQCNGAKDIVAASMVIQWWWLVVALCLPSSSTKHVVISETASGSSRNLSDFHGSIRHRCDHAMQNIRLLCSFQSNSANRRPMITSLRVAERMCDSQDRITIRFHNTPDKRRNVYWMWTIIWSCRVTANNAVISKISRAGHAKSNKSRKETRNVYY